jgi:hypothetical protein
VWPFPPDHPATAGKGISDSALPYKRTPPSWLKLGSKELTEQICKLAKKGLTPSQIGVLLRDSHGVAQVKSVTGTKILRLLKKNGAPAREAWRAGGRWERRPTRDGAAQQRALSPSLCRWRSCRETRGGRLS